MKTPDEIKKGLELHNTAGRCKECPYTADSEFKKTCFQLVAADALAYIQQLETRLAQVERERDALIKHVQGKCHACKHADGFPNEGLCGSCKHTFHAKRESAENWEWRGVCPENTKGEEK